MFSSIIGHDRIKEHLKRHLETRQLHQASLFAGPQHIGKMSMASEFVSLLKTGQSFDPSSSFGKQFLAGQGSGLMVFFDNGKSLKVDEVRRIHDFASFRTAEDDLSFCIIEHAERLTHGAANALLKILEEPTSRLVFILTTCQERKLIPTLRSRMQAFHFSMVPERQTEVHLRTRVGNPLMVEELMKLSAGRIGLALALSQDEELLTRMRNLYDYAQMMFDRDFVDRFRLAEHLTKEDFSEAELSQFLVYLAGSLRKRGIEDSLRPLEKVQRLKRLFSDTQVNKRLFLEELFLSL